MAISSGVEQEVENASFHRPTKAPALSTTTTTWQSSSIGNLNHTVSSSTSCPNDEINQKDSRSHHHSQRQLSHARSKPAYGMATTRYFASKKSSLPHPRQYIALDCEMVVCHERTVKTMCVQGSDDRCVIYDKGRYVSYAARVALVDWKGRILLHTFCQPAGIRSEQSVTTNDDLNYIVTVSTTTVITDYRTPISGIDPTMLQQAKPLDEVKEHVRELMDGKVIVGHGLDNDFLALRLSMPHWSTIRDTAYYVPFMKRVECVDSIETYNWYQRCQCNIDTGQSCPIYFPRKLRDLVYEKLNHRNIQIPGAPHDPVQDCMAALDLYKSQRPRWEAFVNKSITGISLISPV
jgi:hypothetical protein